MAENVKTAVAAEAADKSAFSWNNLIYGKTERSWSAFKATIRDLDGINGLVRRIEINSMARGYEKHGVLIKELVQERETLEGIAEKGILPLESGSTRQANPKRAPGQAVGPLCVFHIPARQGKEAHRAESTQPPFLAIQPIYRNGQL